MSPAEPIWVTLEVALAVHEEQLAEHGGAVGLRDVGLLESAIARPRQLYADGERSLTRPAAAYAFAMARKHPFLDGNKRVSLVLTDLFLELNGLTLTASDAECVTTFLRIASGELDEEGLATWIGASVRSG